MAENHRCGWISAIAPTTVRRLAASAPTAVSCRAALGCHHQLGLQPAARGSPTGGCRVSRLGRGPWREYWMPLSNSATAFGRGEPGIARAVYEPTLRLHMLTAGPPAADSAR